MEKFEYKTLSFETTGFNGGILDAKEFNGNLNRYGQEGWELVSAFDTNQAAGASRYVIAVLKRKISDHEE